MDFLGLLLLSPIVLLALWVVAETQREAHTPEGYKAIRAWRDRTGRP